MRRISLLFVGIMLSSLACARPVNLAAAETAVRNWLQRTPAQPRLRQIRTLTDERNRQLAYIADLEGGGFVILSLDDDVEPVIAFSTEGAFCPSPQSPLWDLLKQDLPRRYRRGRGAQDRRPAQSTTSREKWSQLIDPAASPAPPMNAASDPMIRNNYLTLYDIRVGPLVLSKWGQGIAGGTYCYNYYTPSHYPAGCTATAVAQLLRYHQYPAGPVGTIGNYISLDGWDYWPEFLRGGDGLGGAYPWSQMSLNPAEGLTLAQRQAVGGLCFDAGIALGMNYQQDGSGAIAADLPTALLYFFDYSRCVHAPTNAAGYTPAQFTAMINPNLDAGLPVLLSIDSTAGELGHTVIADGYGYIQSALYHHINMGWDGRENAWYNLPNLITNGYSHDLVKAVDYNIFPTGTGEIISGRVFDNQDNLLEGVTVSILRDAGPIYSCVTNDKGIFALVNVTPGRHTLTAEKPGYLDAQLVVNISPSTEADCGNIWGANLCLFDPNAIGAYGGGSGTALDPFRIDSPVHLREMLLRPDDYDKHFLLAADLDMTGQVFERAPIAPDPGGGLEFLGTAFTGVFDGGGHTIRHLTVSTGGVGNHYLGLFGKVGPGGEIRDLALEDASVTGASGSRYAGGLCGMNAGTIRRCGAVGSVSGGTTGTVCYGGLVGYNEGTGRIESCFVTSEVAATQHVGGLVGYTAGAVTNCHASGRVVSYDDPDYGENIGGIAGLNFGTISYCYSRATLDPTTGASAAFDGAICGLHYDGSVTHCRFDRQTSGTLAAFGYYYGSYSDVTGYPTADMKLQSTYAGWDFSTLWQMSESGSSFEGYPILQWQQADDPPAPVALRLELPGSLIEQRPGLFYCYADYADGSTDNVSTKAQITLPAAAFPESTAGEDEGIPPTYDNAVNNVPTLSNYEFVDDGTDLKLDFSGGELILNPDLYSQTTKAIGSSGCVLFTKPVLTDTSLEVSASFGGLTVIGTVLIKNQAIQFAGGAGTSDDPYQIATAEQFLNAGASALHADRHFKLIADIDLADYYFTSAVLWPDQKSDPGFQGTPFIGVFDGGGHRITGLRITAIDPTDHYLGLFGRIGPAGRVFDLAVESAAAFCNSAEHSGLLAGQNEGTIRRCKATGLILQDVASRNTGLLCGSNAGLVEDCYTLGIATTPQNVGGITGQNTGTLGRCFTAAVLDGDRSLGPLCGDNQAAIEACFWNTDMFDTTPAADGTGLPGSQMRTAAPYLAAGWPFAEHADEPVWHMPWQSAGHPRLWFERDIPGDLAGGYGVEMSDLGLLAAAWGANENEPHWNGACDLAPAGLSAGVIDLEDLAVLLEYWLTGR